MIEWSMSGAMCTIHDMRSSYGMKTLPRRQGDYVA